MHDERKGHLRRHRLRRRSVDRIEDAVAWMLFTLALLTVAVAAATRIYSQGMLRVDVETRTRTQVQAVLLEPAPQSRPGAAGQLSSAERWCAIADQALVAAVTWGEDRDPPSALACPSCSRLLPWGVLRSAGSSLTSRVLQCPACGTFVCVQAVPVESLGRAQRPSVGRTDAVQDRSSLVDALDNIVAGRLFTVGLRLHEAASSTDGELRSRLELAVRDLDECVDEVRRVALHLAV